MQFDRLKRREFIKLIGGAIAWPLAARAQQPTKLPIIGFLGASTPSGWGPWVAAFQQRMRELGWIESRTVEIDYRWAEGRPERYSEIAAEFVRLKVRVIVTVGSAVPAVRQVTSAIPIVFAVAVDPLSRIWRDREKTLLGSRSSRLNLPASDLKFCARFSPLYGGWLS
jgi:putative ABC transport system substrate-binding protein